jgi:hypothetical protein
MPPQDGETGGTTPNPSTCTAFPQIRSAGIGVTVSPRVSTGSHTDIREGHTRVGVWQSSVAMMKRSVEPPGGTTTSPGPSTAQRPTSTLIGVVSSGGW